MADDDVIVLNEPFAGLQRRERNGKARYTISVRSEPIAVNCSAKDLGRGPAEAIAAHLRERVGSISQVASKATLAARRHAAAAFARGEAWAMKRYSGGRTGPMAPNQSDRLFHDSGRLAKTIVANARDDAYTINVAANRLDPATAGGAGAVERIYARLVQLVPEFGNPALLMDSIPVRRAVQEGVKGMVVKMQATTEKVSRERIRGLLGIGRQLLELGRAVSGG